MPVMFVGVGGGYTNTSSAVHVCQRRYLVGYVEDMYGLIFGFLKFRIPVSSPKVRVRYAHLQIEVMETFSESRY